jgi:two-component system LytT family sensor kinase
VLIMAREEYGRLVLSVSDDGRAGSRAGGEPVRPGHGIGLANVCERLAARFGDTASITCGDTGQGYATMIRLPILPGKEMGDHQP